MHLHLQNAVFIVVELSTGHHVLLGQDVVQDLFFAEGDLGVLIAQENGRLGVLLGVDCQDIETPLAELLILLVEDQPVLEVAAVTEGVKVDLVLFDELEDAVRSGLVEVKLDLSVLVQRDDLECLLGEVLEGVQLCLVFGQIAVAQHSSFQLYDVTLSLRQGGGDCVSAVLPGLDCYVVALIN